MKMLGSRDITLISADAKMQFLVEKLGATKNAISDQLCCCGFSFMAGSGSILPDQLCNALRRRIAERRTEIFSVVKYLHSPTALNETWEDETFAMPTRARIRMIIREFVERLFPPSQQDGVD